MDVTIDEFCTHDCYRFRGLSVFIFCRIQSFEMFCFSEFIFESVVNKQWNACSVGPPKTCTTLIFLICLVSSIFRNVRFHWLMYTIFSINFVFESSRKYLNLHIVINVNFLNSTSIAILHFRYLLQ